MYRPRNVLVTCFFSMHLSHRVMGFPCNTICFLHGINISFMKWNAFYANQYNFYTQYSWNSLHTSCMVLFIYSFRWAMWPVGLLLIFDWTDGSKKVWKGLQPSWYFFAQKGDSENWRFKIPNCQNLPFLLQKYNQRGFITLITSSKSTTVKHLVQTGIHQTLLMTKTSHA